MRMLAFTDGCIASQHMVPCTNTFQKVFFLILLYFIGQTNILKLIDKISCHFFVNVKYFYVLCGEEPLLTNG